MEAEFYSLIAFIPGKYHQDEKGLYTELDKAEKGAQKVLEERSEVRAVGIYNMVGKPVKVVEREPVAA